MSQVAESPYGTSSLPASMRWLFIDMNSFFTSVEQQECPEYRGRPTIVVPVLADTTCALAASYEAKALGIKTGTSVRLAKLACPDLQIVNARPHLYLEYHNRIVEILNDHFATVRPLSIDEMACRIPALYRGEDKEEALTQRIKQQITKELGVCMRGSVGLGPNVFLSKVAAERQKPNGMTIWNERNLPEALFALSLTDLPGIASRMNRRLNRAGITTVEALWNASALELRQAWGSVVGDRWYHMLRGSQEVDYQPMLAGEVHKTVGHSNVLAPQHRTLAGAQGILLELCAKGLKRLRGYDQVASAVAISVQYRKLSGMPAGAPNGSVGSSVSRMPSQGRVGTSGDFTPDWGRTSRKHLHANDDVTWMARIRPILNAMPDYLPMAEPFYVGITFSNLLATRDMNLSLFDENEKQSNLARIIDGLNLKYDHSSAPNDSEAEEGKKRVPTRGISLAARHIGAVQVPRRIPFGSPDIHT